uniref:Uncharacterized protein n=1 Tax=Helianthus annuus TaxID=4232 RepID=A0A251UUD0_HELAN
MCSHAPKKCCGVTYTKKRKAGQVYGVSLTGNLLSKSGVFSRTESQWVMELGSFYTVDMCTVHFIDPMKMAQYHHVSSPYIVKQE